MTSQDVRIHCHFHVRVHRKFKAGVAAKGGAAIVIETIQVHRGIRDVREDLTVLKVLPRPSSSSRRLSLSRRFKFIETFVIIETIQVHRDVREDLAVLKVLPRSSRRSSSSRRLSSSRRANSSRPLETSGQRCCAIQPRSKTLCNTAGQRCCAIQPRSKTLCETAGQRRCARQHVKEG